MLDPIIDKGRYHTTRAVGECGAVREEYVYGWGFTFSAVDLQTGEETRHETYRSAKAEAEEYYPIYDYEYYL